MFRNELYSLRMIDSNDHPKKKNVIYNKFFYLASERKQ